MHLDRDSGQLSSRLREWRLEAPRDPAFRARVWERIDAGVATVTWLQFARRHALVVAAVVLLAFVGGAAGGRGRGPAMERDCGWGESTPRQPTRPFLATTPRPPAMPFMTPLPPTGPTGPIRPGGPTGPI